MKKILLLVMLLISLCTNIKEMKELDIKEENNVVEIRYLRRWIYGADYVITDDNKIQAILDCLDNIVVMNEVNYEVTDFTDILVLINKDGTEKMYEFEEYNIVLDSRRYAVSGITELRKTLEEVIR